MVVVSALLCQNGLILFGVIHFENSKLKKRKIPFGLFSEICIENY